MKYCGVDLYNLSETDEVAATVTAYTGQSTATGPKVAFRKSMPLDVVAIDMGGGKSSSNISKNISPTITCTHGGEPIIGAQKKEIKKIGKEIMKTEENNCLDVVNEVIDSGCEANIFFISLKNILESIRDGYMTVDEAIKACGDMISSIGEEEYYCIVRRLMPIETARLQGFDDDYTRIDGDETSDAPQYKSHGNSWATPCANFISTRMDMEIRRLGHKDTIRYATCCSGIEAQSVAVKNLDWKSIFFSEIENFPCRVLEKHYPNTPNLGDMTKIHYDVEKGVITNSCEGEEEEEMPSGFRKAPIQEIEFKEGELQVFSGGTPCFTAGHLILIGESGKAGEKKIEDVEVGDVVYTHKGNLKKVLRIGNKKAQVCKLVVEDGTVFYVTSNHPFLGRINGGGVEWINVEKIIELTKGGCIVDLASWRNGEKAEDYRFHRVESVDMCAQEEMVYNIEVEEDHSYICNGFCVHNCQDISVAGKRAGMAEGSGTRSSLAFHFQRIIDELRPEFTLWENVIGSFSANGGADFIWFVNKCAESGYAMAWRVLDAQYVTTEEFPRAVPQRRRRIWLVGYKGNDWRVPARICFESKKRLTSEPPIRIPGIGFKTLNEGVDIKSIKDEYLHQTEDNEVSIFDGMTGSNEGEAEVLNVSEMIDFSEMPAESDFSKVGIGNIMEFARKVGEFKYIGPVFRTDKKKKKKKEEQIVDLFDMANWVLPTGDESKEAEDKEEEWEGAEKICPAILENIGNSGILANGMICTMECAEWTSGIQLSPNTYEQWKAKKGGKTWFTKEEIEELNAILPDAFDGTVCGLSDILVDEAGEKYTLSWRACYGILRRAETRGKELPELLREALIDTLCQNAAIVKWVALNGKETKKNEGDSSEREAAMICYDKYIASIIKWEDVKAEEPKKRDGEDEELEEAESDLITVGVDEESLEEEE